MQNRKPLVVGLLFSAVVRFRSSISGCVSSIRPGHGNHLKSIANRRTTQHVSHMANLPLLQPCTSNIIVNISYSTPERAMGTLFKVRTQQSSFSLFVIFLRQLCYRIRIRFFRHNANRRLASLLSSSSSSCLPSSIHFIFLFISSSFVFSFREFSTVKHIE